jgi:hypothetical protein
MTPGSYPLSLYRGDSYRWRFTLYDDVAQTQPTDLTDVEVNSQIRDKPGGSLIATLSCTVTLPNVIDAVLSASDCAQLPNSAAWDLQLNYASGDVATVLAGAVNVTTNVTNTSPSSPIPFRPPLRAPQRAVYDGRKGIQGSGRA